MKKFIAFLFCAILCFSLVGCTLDLGGGVYLNENGIFKGSNEEGNNNGLPTISGTVGDGEKNSANTSNGGNVETPTSNTQTPTSSNPPKSTGGTQTPTSSNPPKSTGGTQTPTSSTPPKSEGGTQPGGDVSSSLKPLSCGGLSEAAYATWADGNVANAKVYYKLSSASSYTEVDKELVRKDGNNARVDILGLKAGSYDIRIDVGSENSDIEVKNIAVNAYDRSGFAHQGVSGGVGAYNNDGTLKSGVKVFYVTEATKNSVSIISALQSGNACVRILGKISCPQYLSANKLDSSITDIKGIARKNMGDDSYWNMIDISGKSNITVEGVGTDAQFFQFGLTFKKCQSIEVRNITFTDYPEDACSFEGDNSNPSSYKNYWVHNNQFNVGKNGWDLTSEQDKHQGDGATDIKGVSNVTMSYNYYNGCKKTMLVGGSDSHKQDNVTLHHNYYKGNKSRLPLARYAKVHIYNCYYESNSTCMSARANAKVSLEANYFYKNSSITDSSTKYKISSFGNKWDGTSKSSYISEVSSISMGYTPTHLTNADQAKTECQKYSGVCKGNA